MTLKSKKLVKIKNISHGFFGKKGGVSSGIYTALNCGPGSNDKISKRNTYAWWFLGLYFYGIIDFYVDYNLKNFPNELDNKKEE